jgi:hypothetical protein
VRDPGVWTGVKRLLRPNEGWDPVWELRNRGFGKVLDGLAICDSGLNRQAWTVAVGGHPDISPVSPTYRMTSSPKCCLKLQEMALHGLNLSLMTRILIDDSAKHALSQCQTCLAPGPS